jgi:protein TonB
MLAAGLHAAVLLGVKIAQPSLSPRRDDIFDVALLSEPGDVSAPAAAPVAPELPPPVVPEPETALVPPLPVEVAVSEVLTPEPPRVVTTVGPSKITASVRAPRPGRVAVAGRVSGGGGRGAGASGLGDHAHADWRNRVTPVYPAGARAERQTGRVLVTVNVSSTGEATSVRVSASSGVRALDEAALLAARESTYNPRVVDGTAVPDTVVVPYTFRLQGG